MQSRATTDLAGIDISHYDDGLVVKDIVTQGKKIVYMKASEGSDLADATFPKFNTAIRALGVKTGAYHFLHFYKTSTVDAQVKLFLKQITGQTLDCALVVDCEQEGWHDNLENAAVTAQALAFADAVKAATGAAVIFYSDTYFIKEHFTADIKRLNAWIADIRNTTAPGSNGLIDSWVGFQYSFTGKVGGQTVDLDAFTKGILLAKPFTYGTIPPPVPKPSDPAVAAYQHKLNDIHVRDDNGNALAEDGIDGPKTKQAVIRLEKLMSLKLDSGIWGSQCEGAYKALIGTKPQLTSGSKNKFVSYLQYRLGGLAIDGIYGPLTLAKVKAYQTMNSLKVDGIVGPETWGSLMK